MYLSVLTSTILPLMALAAPASLSVRQDECTPKLYDLGDFDYSNGPSGSNVTLFFGFQSSFKDPSIINDPAVGRVTCSAKAPSVDSFPNEVECSSGRANLMFDLRAPVNKFNYQIIHTWQCNGQSWMSSTPHQVSVLCRPKDDGSTSCQGTQVGRDFAPQNVRRICSTPTCS